MPDLAMCRIEHMASWRRYSTSLARAAPANFRLDLAFRLAEQRGGFGADDGVKKKRLRRPSSSTVGDAVY